MEEFKQYRRKGLSEMREVTQDDIDFFKTWNYISEGFQIYVSISQADLNNGSPKIGDMIARNPKDHDDVWLVAEAYFNDNLELVE